MYKGPLEPFTNYHDKGERDLNCEKGQSSLRKEVTSPNRLSF